ncbi:uncharacterized protein LAJ45_10617 [Morchella importuna]|uniref:Uncharacterized protein n=1 Tax=Morchella conica CCBAS932 TaxID=1392247 RepID=A0A3N4L475_9PEZI|nr:uncharacterized protein LAJ45_10617 [Morchella importuna]KAH8145336.1 hypothetical protein LAJ45_10617 [Morchella importuna]RPB17356.1 hypothetical protein P167DRAFT_531599 [Morchella conica CCBAS932]
MASEQTSTGKLYAALISRLENDKAQLERERDFLKKELAIQTYRNRKLEKEIEELKKRDRKQTVSARLPKPRTTNVRRPPIELADSDSDCSESTTATTDTELERTPAPSPKRSPEMRPVTTPQNVMPLWMALAEETIPERAGSSHEIPAPQPPRFEKDDGNEYDNDIITNFTSNWDRWNSIAEVPEPLYMRGKLVELSGGIQTTFTIDRMFKVRLIRADDPKHDISRLKFSFKYGCRLECVCGLCMRSTDSVNKRLKIVDDELHLDGETEGDCDTSAGLKIEADKDLEKK